MGRHAPILGGAGARKRAPIGTLPDANSEGVRAYRGPQRKLCVPVDVAHRTSYVKRHSVRLSASHAQLWLMINPSSSSVIVPGALTDTSMIRAEAVPVVGRGKIKMCSH